MSEVKKSQLSPVFKNLESALHTWWKHLKKFVMVYVWGLIHGLVPLAAAALLSGFMYWRGGSNSVTDSLISIIIFVAALIAAYYFIRGYLGAFLLLKNNYEGDEKAIYKSTEAYFWPYLGLALLTAVFVLLWSLLLIIPGIIYGIFYSFSVFAFFFEDKRGRAAMRRSTDLITGYWWPVFGRLAFIAFVVWLFTVIVSLPMYYVAIDSVFYQIWSIVVQVISFLVGPIVLIYDYHIYRDLVNIKDKKD